MSSYEYFLHCLTVFFIEICGGLKKKYLPLSETFELGPSWWYFERGLGSAVLVEENKLWSISLGEESEIKSIALLLVHYLSASLLGLNRSSQFLLSCLSPSQDRLFSPGTISPNKPFFYK